MIKYVIPAVNGKVSDEVAKIIRDKATWKDKEEIEVTVNGTKRTVTVEKEKSCITSWIIESNRVIIEAEKEIEGLDKYKV